MAIVLYVAVALTLFLVVALLLTPLIIQPSSAERRLLETVRNTRVDERTIGQRELIEQQLLGIAQRFRATIGLSEEGVLKRRLASAGLGSNSLDLYFAARFLAPVLGIVCGTLIGGTSLMPILMGGAIGYVAPDLWLRTKIRRRRERIRKGVPDAVDLLCICVEAGLGLDQAMMRVGEELRASYLDLHTEFTQINLEQRAGKPRLEAWQSMADRTELPEIAGFVTMLAQTERFGTPIGRALTRLADDIRLKRRQRAEEMAAKSKIKILFPLVIFIFPCIFIVLLAPAVLSLAKTLGGISH